jgi:V8-like Glu-specific endopeptidase
MIQLKGAGLGDVRRAFENAFDVFTFPRLVKERLNRNVYTSGAPLLGDFSSMIEGVANRANQEGWIIDLLNQARETVPGNSELALVAEQAGLSATGKQTLEQVIKKTNSFLDIRTLIARLTVLEYQICRVEVPTQQGDTFYGTGFLVASDLVMTNHHVIDAVIQGEQGKTTSNGDSAKAADMRFRFDYKRMNGDVVSEGTVYRAAESWKYDTSEDEPAGPENLDYAVIRLHTTVGDQAIGEDPNRIGAKRGFITVPKLEYPFIKGSPLWILQHPATLPLKLAFDTEGVIGVSEDGSRVTYTTNTEGGSSGSPCLNEKLEAVALHHSGDPSYPHVGKMNEGIPLIAVRRLLKQRALDGGLG